MGKGKFLTLVGVFGVSTVASAGNLEELKRLLSEKEVQIQTALTADYIFTANRKDEVGNTNGYEDTFGYNAYIGIFKEADKRNPFGFGLSLGNEWSPVVGNEPLPTNDDNVKIHEAYISYKAEGFDIEAGRLLTNIGGEAPYTWQNVNIQRGLVWYGEPVFYNGVRVSGELNGFNVYVGVNDRDTSDGKMALEAGLAAPINGYIDAAFNVLLPDHSDEDNTQIYNLTLNINAFEKMPLTLYADYLYKPQKISDANGFGIALLGEYKVNEKLSIGGRVEYVQDDKNGNFYGLIDQNNPADNSAWTLTLTPKYQLNKYLYVRGELSYVNTDKKIYPKNANGDLTDNEFRLGAELGFVF